MDAFEEIRRAASDRRSGSLAITLRAGRALAQLHTRTEIMRAARILLRAHPTMGALRRTCAVAIEGGDVVAFAEEMRAGSGAAADGARWVISQRATTVLTFSASGAVAEALARARSRVALVLCPVSLPGGEGRPFAKRLARDGFETEVVQDAAIAAAAARADVALVGADAVTSSAVINKLGTMLVALAAREAGIGCYAIACNAKLVGSVPSHAMYEETPLELFDAVLTERGPQRPAQIRRAVARVQMPRALTAIR